MARRCPVWRRVDSGQPGVDFRVFPGGGEGPPPPPRGSGQLGSGPSLPDESLMESEMKLARSVGYRVTVLACLVGLLPSLAAAETVDMGTVVPDAKVIKEGLFPEETCKELEASGFKCMGFKPAVRFSLPTANFRIGSAELPDLLRKQLDVFAEVLRGKRGTGRVLVVEGHADASGAATLNQQLSQKRADAVRSYLVERGAEETMLQAVGRGSSEPKLAGNPFAAENRRVEIGRQ